MAGSSVSKIVEAIKESQNLRQYLLAEVASVGDTIEQGYFGSVLHQVKYRHIECTGKILDDVIDDAEHAISAILQRCHTLSSLTHPNITQFLGLGFIRGEVEYPLLVMERLEMTLEEVLQNAPNLPLLLKLNFMKDICTGLVYLHHLKTGITHRELRAFNVFVTTALVAKISSMGSGLSSKLVVKQRLAEKPKPPPRKPINAPTSGASGSSAASVDVWSFGILSQYILTQICPDGVTSNSVSNSGTARRVSFDLEDSNQEECFRKMQGLLGSYPSLHKLLKCCLHVSPSQRPSSEECLYEIQTTRNDVERIYGTSGVRHLDLQKIRLNKELKSCQRRMRELEICQHRLEADHDMQQRQVDDQLLDLAHKDKQLRDLRDTVNHKDTRIEQLEKELLKYQEQMEMAKEGKLNMSEDEDLALLSDETYSFEQEVVTPVGSLKKSGSSSSMEIMDGKPPENHISPKRKLSGSIKKMIRRTTITSNSSDASSPLSPAKSFDSKRRWSSSSDKENFSPIAILESPTRMGGVTKQPPRGEKRYVYLNTKSGKYGFRLQSYGRVREQGKVMQTFVQSVAPGSAAFMAGLYPGDAIVEVNGVDVKYSPMDSIVEAIKKEALKGDRVLLKVVFADGVTRVDCMKKADDLKTEMKKKQSRLRELVNMEEQYLPPIGEVRISSPLHVVAASEVPVWEESLPNLEVAEHAFPYNRTLNQLVGIHRNNITSLDCDVLVMPLSSCQKIQENGNKNLLMQLLKTGGSRLLDQLSMARHCKVGSNIVTEGHGIRAKYIYHCVVGDLEESLHSCCYKALEAASEEKLSTVVFWLDGFAFLSVSPQLIIESARCWLQQCVSRNVFHRVLFSSKANGDLVEQIMRMTFPLYPSASSRESFTSSVDVFSLGGEASLTNGTNTDSEVSKRDSTFSVESEPKGETTEQGLSEPS